MTCLKAVSGSCSSAAKVGLKANHLSLEVNKSDPWLELTDSAFKLRGFVFEALPAIQLGPWWRSRDTRLPLTSRVPLRRLQHALRPSWTGETALQHRET